MSDLKPCPFCGGRAEKEGHDDLPLGRVKCRNCQIHTMWYANIDDAASVWNTRADSAALAAAVQAEREELIAMCRRLRKEADNGRLITLGGIIGLIEDRMSGGKPIFNVMDDSRPAPAVDVPTDVLRGKVREFIAKLDETHEARLTRRLFEMVEELRALVSPKAGAE